MRQYPGPLQDNFCLDLQMASLAQAQQIPPGAIGWIKISMMYGQCVSRFWIVQMTTTNTPPIVLVLDGLRNLFPIGRIVAR
jgi:hypothetical protein